MKRTFDEYSEEQSGEQNDILDDAMAIMRLKSDERIAFDASSHVKACQEKIWSVLSNCSPKPHLVIDFDCMIMKGSFHQQLLVINSEQSFHEVEAYLAEEKQTLDDSPDAGTILHLNVLRVLRWCIAQQIRISIISKKIVYGNVMSKFLTDIGIPHQFAYAKDDKRRCYQHLSRTIGAEITDFLLFDTSPLNINSSQNIGVRSQLIRENEGLNWQDMIEGVTAFLADQEKRRSIRNWFFIAEFSAAILSSKTGSKSSSNGPSNSKTFLRQPWRPIKEATSRYDGPEVVAKRVVISPDTTMMEYDCEEGNDDDEMALDKMETRYVEKVQVDINRRGEEHKQQDQPAEQEKLKVTYPQDLPDPADQLNNFPLADSVDGTYTMVSPAASCESESGDSAGVAMTMSDPEHLKAMPETASKTGYLLCTGEGRTPIPT